MTEPENFDEDLFADLYADDDTAPKGPSAPQPQAAPVPAPAPVQDDHDNTANGYDYGGGDAQANNDVDDDDDDDVDFNLGNGSTSAAPQDDTPSYSAPTPVPVTKGPNAKEDGMDGSITRWANPDSYLPKSTMIWGHQGACGGQNLWRIASCVDSWFTTAAYDTSLVIELQQVKRGQNGIFATWDLNET